MRWPLVTRKKFEQNEEMWERVVAGYRKAEGNLDAKLKAYEKVWKGPVAKVVLQDLNDALNLIRSYQRSLEMACAADPQFEEAEALLIKYGMKPFQGHRNVLGAQTKIEREEEYWGEEAYGKDTVEIKAERTPEGDRVWFEEVEDEGS